MHIVTNAWLVFIAGLILGSLLTSTFFAVIKHKQTPMRPFDVVLSVMWLVLLYAVLVRRQA